MEHLLKRDKKTKNNKEIFLEILVEEVSMEVFLRTLLQRFIPRECFKIHPFQGKRDLISKLPTRLKGYSKWLPQNHRIIVIIDKDKEDCRKLKETLENIAIDAGLFTKSNNKEGKWQIVNRIVVEELESWFFGDWEAVCLAYCRLPKNIISKKGYVNPDNIKGGTAEALERNMRKYGYFTNGLRKIEIAKNVALYFDPDRNCSHSFKIFWNTVLELIS